MHSNNQHASAPRHRGSGFDIPDHYRCGDTPRLKQFHDRDWWLNVDYVCAEREVDDDSFLQLLLQSRRAGRSHRN